MLSIYTLSIIVLILICWHLINQHTQQVNESKHEEKSGLYGHSMLNSKGEGLFYNPSLNRYELRKPTFREKRFIKSEKHTQLKIYINN